MVSTRRRRVGPTSDPHRLPSSAATKFFKVVLPSTMEKKMLRIPPQFVKNFVPELSHIATLTTPAGLKRQIGIKRVGEEIWFHGGWHEFAEYHSISAGHLLVFDYLGNSVFHVLIFNMTASEINYPRDYVDIGDVDDERDNEGEGFLSSQGIKNEGIKIFDGSSSGSGKKIGGSFDGSEESVIELDESQETDELFHMKMGQDEIIRLSDGTQSRKRSQHRTEPFEVHLEGNEAFVRRRSYKLTAQTVDKNT